MALNYVSLTFTMQDAGQDAQAGSVVIFPTSVVTAAGITVVDETQVVRSLSAGTVTVSLVACDNAGTTPAAGFWAYNIQLPGGAGGVYLVNYSAGASQRFDNLTPAVASTTYGPAAGSGGFQNPMTTAGDLIDGGTAGAAQRLAIGSTGQILSVVSGAPAWQSLDGTAADMQPEGVAAAGAKGLAADAKHVHPRQPWQFLPEAYGALGNGKVVGDVVTNGTTTITSATAAFTNADVGKYVMINGANGAGAGNAPLLTTIASVTNGTTAVLASGAGASVSNCQMVYGTDDTAAIQSAVTAAGNYATGTSGGPGAGFGGYFAEVLFGSKIYILGTGPTQSGNGSSTPTFNAQVTLPYPNANGTTQKLVIALTGAGDAGYCQFWESVIPNIAGSALVSMTTAPSSPSGTFGNQSVIGGPSGAAGFTGGYANTKAVVKGLSVWCSLYTNQFAYDFGYLTAMRVTQSSAHIFAPTGVNTGATGPWLKTITASALLSSIGSGFRTPVNGNNDDVTMDDVTVEGYECGFRVFDHFNAGRLAAIFTDVAMFWNGAQGSSGTAHGIFVQSMSAEDYNGGLLTNGGACHVDINWDPEGTPTNYDVQDNGNALYGTFRYGDKVDNAAPVITGAAHLKVINCNLSPGYWSGAPGVPANNTNQQNTAWRDAWVTITSGGAAVSAITVDGQATGLTLGNSGSVAVRVPSGKNIQMTYASTAPTWKWWLD